MVGGTGGKMDGRRAGRKVQEDPRPQQQIGFHTSKEEQRRSMALQKWGGRGSDDIGAAVLREE